MPSNDKFLQNENSKGVHETNVCPFVEYLLKVTLIKVFTFYNTCKARDNVYLL